MEISIDEITLFSIYLKLNGPWEPKNFPGEALHGFLFNLPGLSRYHSEEAKPFSLRLVAREGHIIKWEACALRIEVAQSLTGIKLPRKARLGNTRVVDILAKPIASTNFGLLLRARNRTNFSFGFRSPTSFRSQGQQLLFPTPDLFFGSLMQRWNAFARKKVTREIAEDFRKILVTRYSLETQEVSFSDYKIIGFTGEVCYRIPPGTDPVVKKVVNALARLAPFAGVGYKTPMGLGWVEAGGGGDEKRA